MLDKDIDLLERYTHGAGLTAAEEAALRTRITQDPVFAREVREWELMTREGFVDDQSEVASIREEVLRVVGAGGEPMAKINPSRRWLWFGLLLAVLLFFVLWRSGKFTDTSAAVNPVYAEIVDEYFVHVPAKNLRLSAGGDPEQQALGAYEAREYGKALPLLLEVVAQGGDSLNLVYAGVAALAVGEYETVLQIPVPSGGIQAETLRNDLFYLKALAELATGRKEAAVENLQLINGEHTYPIPSMIKKIE